jgi:hypothetical protein
MGPGENFPVQVKNEQDYWSRTAVNEPQWLNSLDYHLSKKISFKYHLTSNNLVEASFDTKNIIKALFNTINNFI